MNFWCSSSREPLRKSLCNILLLVLNSTCLVLISNSTSFSSDTSTLREILQTYAFRYIRKIYIDLNHENSLSSQTKLDDFIFTRIFFNLLFLIIVRCLMKTWPWSSSMKGYLSHLQAIWQNEQETNQHKG